jgi:hypothetical protein
MRRIMLLLAVAGVMSAMLVYSGFAWAHPTTCQATSNANPSGGGNARPGQAGDRSRTAAEANHKLFGQGTAQNAPTEEDCFPAAEAGPPGAFDPKATP